MKTRFIKFTSVLLTLTMLLCIPFNAFAESINTAKQVEFGKTYTQHFTYNESNGEGESDSYYWFKTGNDTNGIEIDLTFNSEVNDSVLDNTYLELIDNNDSEVASGIYNPDKNVFHLSYYDDYGLEKNTVYFIIITCYDKADTSMIVKPHIHKFDKLYEKSKAWTYGDTKIDGYCEYYCECGEESYVTIPYAKTFSISNISYTFDGKAKKPTVTVKDRKGKKLKEGKDYSVEYANGRKNVGKYSVKISLKGNYTGDTITKYFTINPKETAISKISAKKKAFNIKWKKQKVQTSGYKIQYSTNKNMKNAKTVIVKSSNKTSFTVKKLKGNKKYYVRVCTYKGKYTSSWSKVKTVTTKK